MSFGFEALHPLYESIKSYFCCDISAFLFTIWKDLTTTGTFLLDQLCAFPTMALLAGAISLLVTFLGFFALHKIDRMPRVDCCGCSCRRQYLHEILDETEDKSFTTKIKAEASSPHSRKGTQIGTEVV